MSDANLVEFKNIINKIKLSNFFANCDSFKLKYDGEH